MHCFTICIIITNGTCIYIQNIVSPIALVELEQLISKGSRAFQVLYNSYNNNNNSDNNNNNNNNFNNTYNNNITNINDKNEIDDKKWY